MCNLLSYDNHIVTKFFNSLIFTSSTKNLYYRHIFAKTKINFRESTKQKYLYDKPSLQLATASAAPQISLIRLGNSLAIFLLATEREKIRNSSIQIDK